MSSPKSSIYTSMPHWQRARQMHTSTQHNLYGSWCYVKLWSGHRHKLAPQLGSSICATGRDAIALPRLATLCRFCAHATTNCADLTRHDDRFDMTVVVSACAHALVLGKTRKVYTPNWRYHMHSTEVDRMLLHHCARANGCMYIPASLARYINMTRSDDFLTVVGG